MKIATRTKPGRPNYYIVVTTKDPETKKRKDKWIQTDISIRGNNKRLAEARRREIEIEYENYVDEPEPESDVLFTDYLLQWLEIEKSSWASSTYQLYVHQIQKHILPYFLLKKVNLKDLSADDLESYRDEKLMDVSSNTVRKYLTNINKCLNDAVKKRLISYNPMSAVNFPKKEEFHGAEVYDESQIIKLLEVSKEDPTELMILLTVTFGLRRSELLGLKWDAVNFEQATITIQHTVTRITDKINKEESTKNKSSHRTYPLSDEMINLLQNTKQEQDKLIQLQPNDWRSEGYIFVNHTGKLISPDVPTRRFQRLVKRHGLPVVIRLHDLRHSAATYLMHLGLSAPEIMDWLGHSDIRTTLKYLHFNMSGKRKILDKINSGLQRNGVS